MACSASLKYKLFWIEVERANRETVLDSQVCFHRLERKESGGDQTQTPPSRFQTARFVATEINRDQRDPEKRLGTDVGVVLRTILKT